MSFESHVKISASGQKLVEKIYTIFTRIGADFCPHYIWINTKSPCSTILHRGYDEHLTYKEEVVNYWFTVMKKDYLEELLGIAVSSELKQVLRWTFQILDVCLLSSLHWYLLKLPQESMRPGMATWLGSSDHNLRVACSNPGPTKHARPFNRGGHCNFMVNPTIR